MFIIIFVALVSAAFASGLTALYFSHEMSSATRNHELIAEEALDIERKSAWKAGFFEGKFEGVMLDEDNITTFVHDYYRSNIQ